MITWIGEPASKGAASHRLGQAQPSSSAREAGLSFPESCCNWDDQHPARLTIELPEDRRLAAETFCTVRLSRADTWRSERSGIQKILDRLRRASLIAAIGDDPDSPILPPKRVAARVDSFVQI